MRQTIIGVAAPANAPPNLEPSKGSAEPVPAVRAVSRPNMPAAGRARPIHNRTIIGGLEATPGHAPGPETRAETPHVDAPINREPKRTMLGGLEASAGGAPAPKAVGLGFASEARWNVLIPKQGAVEMTAPELVRAFVEGKITREANAWREGLEGWQPMHAIEELRTVFQRAGLSLDAASTASSADSRRPVRPSAAPAHSADAPSTARTAPARGFAPKEPSPRVSEPPPTAREPALTDVSGELFDAETPDDSDEVTRIAASPWEVPDVGAKATARLASSAGLPPRQQSIPPISPRDLDHPLPERASRRPDIHPRDTVRGQIRSLSSEPSPMVPSPGGPRDALTAPRIPTNPGLRSDVGLAASQAITTRPPPPPLVPMTPPSHGDARESSALTSRATAGDTPNQAPAAKPRTRPRRTAWLVAALVVAVLLVLLTVSYRTKQPRAFHAYLHRSGWDVRIDRTLRTTSTRLNAASQRYLVDPWRAMTGKTRKARTQ